MRRRPVSVSDHHAPAARTNVGVVRARVTHGWAVLWGGRVVPVLGRQEQVLDVFRCVLLPLPLSSTHPLVLPCTVGVLRYSTFVDGGMVATDRHGCSKTDRDVCARARAHSAMNRCTL